MEKRSLLMLSIFCLPAASQFLDQHGFHPSHSFYDCTLLPSTHSRVINRPRKPRGRTCQTHTHNTYMHALLGWKGFAAFVLLLLACSTLDSRLVRFTAHLLKKGTTLYCQKVIQQRLDCPGCLNTLQEWRCRRFPLHCAAHAYRHSYHHSIMHY